MSAHKSAYTKSRPQSPQHSKCVYEFVRKPNENRNNEYQLMKMLGEGGFAKCYKAKRSHDQKQFAIKAINLDEKSQSSSKDKKKSLRYPRVSTQQKAKAQAQFLKICNHQNIVRYQTHFTYDNVFYIVMEHCSNGSFGDMLKQRKTITEVQARYFITQMVSGLMYLREKRIIHRDLKPANYLLNDKMQIKIADFGLATYVNNGTPVFSNICGTPNYLSPEMLSKTDYSYEVDVWSLGVALYAMLYGMPPFETKKKDAKETYQKIKRCEYTLNSSKVSVSPQAKDLISKILILDPTKRILLQQILDHPFMSYFEIPRELPYRCLRREPDARFLAQYQRKISGENEGYRGRSVIASVREKASYNKFSEKGQENNKKPMRYCPPEFQKEQKPEKSYTKCQYDNKYENIRESIKKEIRKITSEKRSNQIQTEPSRRPKSISQVMKKYHQQQVVTSSPISSNASIKTPNQNTTNNKYIQYPSSSPNSNPLITQTHPHSNNTSNIYYQFPASSQAYQANPNLPSYTSIECQQPSPEPLTKQLQIPFPSFVQMMRPLSYRKGQNYEEYLQGIKMDWKEIGRVNLRGSVKEGDKIRRSFRIADGKARSKKILIQNSSSSNNFNTKTLEPTICSLEDFLASSSSLYLKSSKLFKLVYCLKQQPSINSQSLPHHPTRYIGLIFNDNSSIVTKLTLSQNQLTYCSVYIRNVLNMRTDKKNLYEKVGNENYVKNCEENAKSEDWFVVELEVFEYQNKVKCTDGQQRNKIAIEMNYELRMKLKLASTAFKLFKPTLSKDFPHLFTKSQSTPHPILLSTPSTLTDFKFINLYQSRQSTLYFEMNDGSKHYLEKSLTRKSHLDLFRKSTLHDVRSYRYAVYFSVQRAGFVKEAGEEWFRGLGLAELNANVGEKRQGSFSKKEHNVKILQQEVEQGEIQKITKKVKRNQEVSKSSSSKQSSKYSQKLNLISTVPKPQNSTTNMLQKICKQFQSKMQMHYLRERDSMMKKRQESILKSRGEFIANPGSEFRENRFCRLEIQNGNIDFKLKKQGEI